MDADDVIDLPTGEVHPAVVRVIHALGTYTEVSCSGTGLHGVGVGKKPEYAKCKSDALGFDIEVYDGVSGARFMVMTGQTFGEAREIAERQRELDVLCGALWPRKKKAPSGGTQRTPVPSRPLEIDDETLLERARRARSGPKFRRLYDHGDISGYRSASEADLGLVNMLIFWTRADEERITRLFESSALYREPPEKHAR